MKSEEMFDRHALSVGGQEPPRWPSGRGLRLRSVNVIGQCEVQLTFFQIGSRHLDADGISQLVSVVMAAANQLIMCLVKFVIVALQVAYGYHAFAVVLVYLHVDAIRLYAGDMSVETLSQFVAHELHHLVLDGLPFSILCRLLHIAGMFAKFLEVVLVGRAAASLITSQQTVHHRVGV